MKQTDGYGNEKRGAVRGAFTTEVVEENPYLQRPTEEHESHSSSTEKEVLDEIIEDEDGAPVEPEDESRRAKYRRRRLALLGMATLLLLAIVFAIAVYRHSPTRVDYGRTTSQSKALPPVPNTNTAIPRDSRTDKAIQEAQRLTGEQSTRVTASPIETEAAADRPSRTLLDTPFKVPVGSNDPITNVEQGTDSPPNTETNLSGEKSASASPSESYSTSVRSQRSLETSLYMNDPASDRVITAAADTKDSKDSKTPLVAEKRDKITLPAFASMLPVRTLGALYTLRTGALVRFELTRETKGDGWSLKRGTILVGSSKGGDFDRAYVSLIGFIDPQSGKLLKLGGEVLGGDGAAGLKGKRRQLNGGWTRALGRLASSALDVTGALLSGRGRDTVIISDGLRTRTINPVTDEISGVFGSELERRQGRSFVEVMAGTPGYVLVTDLPSVIDGTEPTPEVNSDTLASLTDVDATRPATGLSERELAELLANGSPEQIRAAMPRMSPEMRKIAAAVLRP